MPDNFDFAALANSWQQQPGTTEPVPNVADLTSAKQRQARQKWLMYSEWLAAVVMIVAACWLILTIPDWLGYLSASFLLFGALSSACISWTVHRPILQYDNWSSSGLLQFRSRACQLTLRYYLYIQLSCLALLVFTALLWLLHWSGIAQVASILLIVYSVVTAPLCLLALKRLQQKKVQKTAELQQLRLMTQDFQADDQL